MTTSQLENRITLKFQSSGHYNATVTRNGKEVKVLVTDMTIVDTIKKGYNCCGLTLKRALTRIWLESKN